MEYDPFEPLNWQVVEVTKGDKRWWEVRAKGSLLVVSNSMTGGAWRFRSERSAIHCRDKRNAEARERQTERVVE
jgi:hypothetical protein